jgi:hypothetical protein
MLRRIANNAITKRTGLVTLTTPGFLLPSTAGRGSTGKAVQHWHQGPSYVRTTGDFRFSRRRVWTQVFWDTAPCSLVEVDRRFRGEYCLHRQSLPLRKLYGAISQYAVIISTNDVSIWHEMEPTGLFQYFTENGQCAVAFQTHFNILSAFLPTRRFTN